MAGPRHAEIEPFSRWPALDMLKSSLSPGQGCAGADVGRSQIGSTRPAEPILAIQVGVGVDSTCHVPAVPSFGHRVTWPALDMLKSSLSPGQACAGADVGRSPIGSIRPAEPILAIRVRLVSGLDAPYPCGAEIRSP